MPFEVALLNLDDGRRLCGSGHGPVAVARLEEAHKAFSHLGADPFVQACAAELAALQVPPGTSRSSGLTAPAPRETGHTAGDRAAVCPAQKHKGRT
jgi:hypothetical protein